MQINVGSNDSEQVMVTIKFMCSASHYDVVNFFIAYLLNKSCLGEIVGKQEKLKQLKEWEMRK